MADKPMIFSAPMVRALLENRKTMTRRIMKPQPKSVDLEQRKEVPYNGSPEFLPPIKVGDQIWVKETFRAFDDLVLYRADGHLVYEDESGNVLLKWKSPLFMPRWASRITLLVEAVKVERLQEISEADCLAEGIDPALNEGHGLREHYWSLWNSLHGEGAWEKNDFCFVYTFHREVANA